jgi:hypothetical protein
LLYKVGDAIQSVKAGFVPEFIELLAMLKKPPSKVPRSLLSVPHSQTVETGFVIVTQDSEGEWWIFMTADQWF